MKKIKSALLQSIYYGWVGRFLRLFNKWMRTKETILSLKNPLFMKYIVTKQAGGIYLSEMSNYIAFRSNDRNIVKFDPDTFEPEITFLMQTLIQPNDNILDIGANIGFHTVTMAKAAFPGHLFAFEPVPEMANQNSINCALNRLNNVTIVDCALGDSNTEMQMHVNITGEGLQGTSTLLNENSNVLKNPDFYEQRTVQIYRLDDLIKKLNITGRIGFIKIDTEGFDALILDGAMKTIKKHKPIMIVEAHSKRLEQTGKSWEWFLNTFKDYHISIIYACTQGKPYLHLEPLTIDLPEISVNLLLLPKTKTFTPKL